MRSCVGSPDNTRRFHADAITTFLRRDTVTRYGIALALPIIIVNVILRNTRSRTHSSKESEREKAKEGKREREKKREEGRGGSLKPFKPHAGTSL